MLARLPDWPQVVIYTVQFYTERFCAHHRVCMSVVYIVCVVAEGE